MVEGAKEERRVQVRGSKFRARVLGSTVTLIEQRGVGNVRVADIAADANVHETSIYRRWKTLPRLLLDALATHTAADVPLPDTGSVRGDLLMFAEDLARFCESPTGRAFVRGVEVIDADSEVEEVRRKFWAQRLTSLEPIVERGKERGEVREDVDSQSIVLLVGGFVTFYSNYLDREVPASMSEVAVNILLAGIETRQ